MTTTARRRWTKELEGEVDGIAIGAAGPILLHGYDPPAGGMWVDSVIPGKLGAIDRASGEFNWNSPCEVGYGRGFGAGFGSQGDVIVLGPSNKGHRAVRMSIETGELLALEKIRPFDEALVFGDVSVCVTAGRISGLMTSTLHEIWEYSKSGERYHHACRAGNRVFVVYTDTKTKKQGVLSLKADTGKSAGQVLPPVLPAIFGLASTEEEVVFLAQDIQQALPQEVVVQFMVDLSQKSEDASMDTMTLLALPANARKDEVPLWYEILRTDPLDEFVEVSIAADSGKLYLVDGALLEVRDMLTGRRLGDWAVPGLDERVDWKVSDGACLLAEETRVSVFELPA